MATQEDVRRIALSMPATSETRDGFGFAVEGKPFVWAWNERVAPDTPRVPNPHVIAVRVENELEKQTLLSMDSAVIFTEPHYNGFPAVLIRLLAIDPALLDTLIRQAWRCRAPKRLSRIERRG